MSWTPRLGIALALLMGLLPAWQFGSAEREFSPDAAAPATANAESKAEKRAKKKQKKRRKKTAPVEVVEGELPEAGAEAEPVFASNAFPPTVPDTQWHRNAWYEQDCLRCHETGVHTAPVVVHRGMPDVLLTAKCRTCHVLIPGSTPRPEEVRGQGEFAANAFPPMMPASESHAEAWTKDDCLMCHTTGIAGAPEIKHEGLPELLLTAKCRTCHVQVRAVDAAAAGAR
jgi:hypothetical protein